MKIIEITEHKAHKLSEHIEEGLRHIGKAMQCVDEWMEESGMGERVHPHYPDRKPHYDGYGMPKYPMYGGYGMRDDDDWDDDDMIGERRRGRRRDSRGRYM